MIVCGLEGVGFRVVEQLHLSGTQVVVIDENPGDGVWLIVHAESNPGQSDGDSMAGLSTDSMCHLDDIEDIL